MALPPRRPKPEKHGKESRWKSQAHLKFVRGFQCAMPACQNMPIEAAHVRIGSGAGMQQKPDDYRAVPLYSFHHQQQHSLGERSFWRMYEAASGQPVEKLIDALCDASPRKAEIRGHRRDL